METFVELKEFESNPHYQLQRENSIHSLTDDIIDGPILKVIHLFNEMSCCFTLQSCYGHFIHFGNKDPHNLQPLPTRDIVGKVEYRIAYIAFCIENSKLGKELFETLRRVPSIHPQNIQFCCAQWFWKKQVNSYVLQVEPERYKHKDKVELDFEEAQYIEGLRNYFFAHLVEIIENK